MGQPRGQIFSKHMFSSEQIHSDLTKKVNLKIVGKEAFKRSIEKVMFLIRESYEMTNVLKIQFVKVLTCLKSFNSPNTYSHIQDFLFRQFSFQVF